MRRVLTLALATAAVAAVAGAATAKAGTATAPPGYAIVRTAPIPAPPAPLIYGGQVQCPEGTVPLGGGAAFLGSIDYGDSINASVPLAGGWEARMGDAGTIPASFRVDAVCANQPQGYSVQFAMADDPAGTQATAIAVCPLGSVLLSGGWSTTSDSARAYVLSAWPRSRRKFKVQMWNGTEQDQRVFAYAVCASKPPRYSIEAQSATTTGPADFVGGEACPAGRSAVGGGFRIANPQPLFTIPRFLEEDELSWTADALVPTASQVTLTWYAICAA
jgi:hypothetical protein